MAICLIRSLCFGDLRSFFLELVDTGAHHMFFIAASSCPLASVHVIVAVMLHRKQGFDIFVTCFLIVVVATDNAAVDLGEFRV